MAVKSPTDQALEQDLNQLLGYVQPVFSALKHGGPPPAVFERAFEECSLGPRHASVLMTVSRACELSVTALAEQLQLSLSTTSLMVGELSRAGLLERVEDERDRRRTLVRLTEAHRADVAAWFNERIEPFRRTLERLSPRARAAFLEGWRLLDEETQKL